MIKEKYIFQRKISIGKNLRKIRKYIKEYNLSLDNVYENKKGV